MHQGHNGTYHIIHQTATNAKQDAQCCHSGIVIDKFLDDALVPGQVLHVHVFSQVRGGVCNSCVAASGTAQSVIF